MASRKTIPNPSWTLGRQNTSAPLYSAAGPERSSGFYNFIIASTAETAGNPVASDSGFVLRRLGPVTCARDPSYDWKLPGYDAIRQGLGR